MSTSVRRPRIEDVDSSVNGNFDFRWVRHERMSMIWSNRGWTSERLGRCLEKLQYRTVLTPNFCISWSRGQLSVNMKTVHFWKILLARAELGNLQIFSLYFKSSDCNGRGKLEGVFWEKQLLPPSHAWIVFHTIPCKFRNFQTVVKYFLTHYGAQIFF